MIAATVAMAGVAALFVVFGVLGLGERRGGCGGECGTCVGECEMESEGSIR